MRGNGPLTIGVDFDGVLFDQIPHILARFQELHGIDLTPVDEWHWDLSQHPEILAAELHEDEVWSIFHTIESDPTVHETGLLDPHALEVLERCRRLGHRVHVATTRREESRAVTEAFLDANGVPLDQVDMHVFPKIGYDVLIDDLPPNVEAAAADGSTALLMDHPYNQGFHTDGNPRRVRNWAHVEQVLEEILHGRW